MSDVNFFLSYGMEGGICRICGKFMLPEPIELDKMMWRCPFCNTRIRQVKGDDGSVAYLEEKKGVMEKVLDSVNPFKIPNN